jgi:uncharacterized SAM-binding protein YcdF (DUF218 family)
MGSTNGTSEKGTKLRLRPFLWSLGALTLLGITASMAAWHSIGKWLVREGPLQRAAAIAVLSGNTPARALEARELYHDGYAKEVWLTQPGLHAGALKALGIDYPSEDQINMRVLRGQGVPAKAIRVLDTPIINTADELDVISDALKNRGVQKVIVVTNKAHTRRVHILWKRYFASRGEVVTRAVSDDDFEASHWWKYSGSMAQVTHEVMGIVNAWAALPVQPAPHPVHEVVAEGPGIPNHPGTD